MRRLYLMRHAHYAAGAADDPPLSPQGRRDAARVGAFLRARSMRPARILCSAARRASETAAIVGASFEPAVAAEADAVLVLAEAATLLAHLRAAPDAAASQMLVGHNPGIQRLALCLSAAGVPAGLEMHYGAGTLLVLDFEIDRWAALAPGTGTPVAVLRG